jgi:hypothetical protein
MARSPFVADDYLATGGTSLRSREISVIHVT